MSDPTILEEIRQDPTLRIVVIYCLAAILGWAILVYQVLIAL